MNKLDGNNRWITKMMLTEHVEGLLQQKLDDGRRTRIQFDDQELAVFGGLIRESLDRRMQVEIRLYDPFEQLRVVGIVERVDNYKRRFMVDGEWFYLEDVEGVDIE